MHMIAYISEFNGEKENVDQLLKDVVKVAKIENQKRHITGVLFFHDNKFLQIVEGKEGDLRQLMDNIRKDNRHLNVEYLIDTKVEQRGFQEWNMDKFHLDSEQKISRDVLKNLTESFKKNLLPRSDMLVSYYKILTQQQAY